MYTPSRDGKSECESLTAANLFCVTSFFFSRSFVSLYRRGFRDLTLRYTGREFLLTASVPPESPGGGFGLNCNQDYSPLPWLTQTSGCLGPAEAQIKIPLACGLQTPDKQQVYNVYISSGRKEKRKERKGKVNVRESLGGFVLPRVIYIDLNRRYMHHSSSQGENSYVQRVGNSFLQSNLPLLPSLT